jgi:hypothetical protein
MAAHRRSCTHVEQTQGTSACRRAFAYPEKSYAESERQHWGKQEDAVRGRRGRTAAVTGQARSEKVASSPAQSFGLGGKHMPPGMVG